MKRVPRFSLPLCLLTIAAACDDRPLAVVALSSLPDDAKTLYVSLTYRGNPATRPAPIQFDLTSRDRAKPANFGVYLPAMTDGDLVVGAGILNTENCLSAVGSGRTPKVVGGANIDVPLTAISTEQFTRDERCADPLGTPLLIGATPSRVSTAGDELVTLIGWWGVSRDKCPTVSVNGSAASLVSCTSVVELVASVPVGTTLGPVPVVVRPQNGTAVAMSSTLLSYYAGKLAFTGGPSYAVGGGPSALAVGMIDADTRPDLLVANRDSGTLSVLVTGGKTELQPGLTTQLSAGPRPSGIGIADLDGDGRADLVSVSTTEGAVRTFLQATPAASPPMWKSPSLTFVNLLPSALATGDLNGDRVADVVVANQISSDVSLLRNDGAGHLIKTKGTDVSVGREPTAVRLVDLNQDGFADLLTTSATNLSLSVALNQGGSFLGSSRSLIELRDTGNGLVVDDFDGNGAPDVVVGLAGGTIVIRWNDGTGITDKSEEVRTSLTSGITAMASGDFDLDGRPDIVVVNALDQKVSILRNTLFRTKKRGLELATTFTLSGSAKPTALAVGNFDADSLPDIAVATQASGQPTGSIQILTNKSN